MSLQLPRALCSWAACLAVTSGLLKFITRKNTEMLQEKAVYLNNILFQEGVELK